MTRILFPTAKRFARLATRARDCHGSVLLYALVLIALSALVFVGWIQVMVVRGNYVNTMEAAMQRRAGLENGEALFRQYVLGNVFDRQSGAAVSAVVPGGWGGVEILEWTGQPFESVVDFPFYNPFNPGGGGGFVRGLSAFVQSGSADEEGIYSEPRRILVGSRSPVLGGSLLTFQRPTLVPSAVTSATTGMQIAGGVFLWNPNSPNTYNFATQRFGVPQVSPPPPTLAAIGGGAGVLPSNIAQPDLFTNDFDGSMNVIDNPMFPANSLSHRLASLSPLALDGMTAASHGTLDGLGNAPIQSDGLGNVTVRLAQNDHLSFVLSNVSRLELVGESGAPASMLVFLIVDGPGAAPELAEVRFTGSNTRPLLLAVKKSSGNELLWSFVSPNPTWTTLGLLENTPLRIVSSGQVDFQGGVRTDRGMDASAASVNLVPLDPAPVENLLDRQAWMEMYSL